MKNNKFIYFGHIISLIFIFLLFKNLNDYRLDKVLQDLNWKYFIFGILINIFGYSVHAFRWRIFFEDHKLKFSDILRPVILGQLMNTILPSKAGELIRPYYLAQTTKLNYLKVLSTCLVERIFDGLTTLGAFFIAIYFFKYNNNFFSYKTALYSSLLFYLLCLCFPLILFKNNKKVESLILKIPSSFTPKILHLFKEFISGLSLIKNIRNIFKVTLLTICYWLIGITTLYLFLLSSPLPTEVQTFKISVLIMGAIGLILTLPSAPANIGVYNFTIYILLESVLRYENILITQEIKNQLITSSIILHIGAIIPDILCGAVAYFTMKDNLLKKFFHQNF